MKINLLISILFLFMFSCTSTQSHRSPVQKSNLTFATVKKNLIKGKTTQAQIIQLLGSPNIITKDQNGLEMWNYSRQSFKSGSESAGMGMGIPFFTSTQNQAFSQSSTSSFDLILKFNSNDVLVNYDVTVSKF